MTLAERHGGAEVTRRMFEGMVEEVAEKLSAFALRAAPAATAQNFHLLGTSGTVTTIAAMHLRLARYERRRVDGLWMSDDEVSAAIDDLLDTRLEQRVDNPCIGRDRPISCSRAVRFWKRCAGHSRPSACASPTAACARAFS